MGRVRRNAEKTLGRKHCMTDSNLENQRCKSAKRRAKQRQAADQNFRLGAEFSGLKLTVAVFITLSVPFSCHYRL
jgi:hypothetical protein